MNSTRVPRVLDLPDWVSGMPYFITGSVRFGCATNTSDLDICIPITVDWRTHLPANTPCEASNYNNGTKFMHNGIVINIVHLHPRVFITWFLAAKMADAIKALRTYERNKRYAMHELLCATASLSIDVDINASNFLNYFRD